MIMVCACEILRLESYCKSYYVTVLSSSCFGPNCCGVNLFAIKANMEFPTTAECMRQVLTLFVHTSEKVARVIRLSVSDKYGDYCERPLHGHEVSLDACLCGLNLVNRFSNNVHCILQSFCK